MMIGAPGSEIRPIVLHQRGDLFDRPSAKALEIRRNVNTIVKHHEVLQSG